MKKLLILCAFLLSATVVSAQFGNLLKKVEEKGKKLIDKKGGEMLDNSRNKLDSTDFNYAISVIDNAGIMNVKDLKESVVKTTSAIRSLNADESDKSPELKSRDLLDIAEKLYESRQYKPAEAYFLAAKLSYEQNQLTNNINYSKVLADLGLLYATMGRYAFAEPLVIDAMDLRQQNLGEKSFAFASSLNNRAMLYMETARYNEAEADYAKAAELARTVVGPQSQEYSIVLNNQAILFARIGRLDDAVKNLNQAVQILNAAGKKSVRNQVGVQSNLAHLYQQQGKYTDAEAIYLRLQKDLGEKDPYYAGALNSLAVLYMQMNRNDQVESLLKKSADIYRSRFGDENPSVARVLNDLGNFYRMQGRLADAETTLLKALAIREVTLGKSHPDYAVSQENLGILYWKKGDLEQASAFLSFAMNQALDFINRYFPPMSESEKTKYWDLLQPRFQRYFNFVIEQGAQKPSLIQDAYDYQIATKALLLNSTNKVKKAILGSGDVALIRDYATWLDQKETLARVYAYSKAELKEQKINVDSLERATNATEKSLSQRSRDFSQGYSAEKISWKQVAAQLSDQEAALEIIRVRGYVQDFTADSRYIVLALTKTGEPRMVVLDNGNQLETRYAKFYRNAITQRLQDTYSYDQFWGRIAPVVSGKKVLFVSPDGVYNQVNLNTLKKTEGDYLIRMHDIIVLGNSKDLVAIRARKPSGAARSAMLMGFPDYGGNQVAALPGTRVELEGISKVLKANGYTISQFMQKDATEKNLKSVKGPQLVHLATHGYFLADAEVGSGSSMGVSAENARNNPLLRSGLLLVGAATTMAGDALPSLVSNDNGILTAYEAMNLNLTGTDLIVLSACETGLGDVRSGEGVYGLQRAFQVAGANAMVMSLWKVDDAATQALMNNFYAAWAKGGDKLKAFKQAQMQLITQYKDPYFWGAFVMMGM